MRHEGLRLVQWVAETWQHGEFSIELTVSWHQYWRQYWTVDPLVVIRVNAHILLLRSEGKLAALQGLELMVGLQVRPTPHATVDDVR